MKSWFSVLALAIITLSLMGSKPLPKPCQNNCSSPYGQVLGATANGVKAYSNCSSHCVIFDPHHQSNTYTGMRWQCVEFARRWLLTEYGMVYGNVDIAADIWSQINYLKSVVTQEEHPLVTQPNGSDNPLQPGDLIIYSREFLGTGHIAVVTEVNLNSGYIRVAEQNYHNQPWPGNYARELPLVSKNKRYWVLDAYLLGWKRLESHKKPFSAVNN